MVDSHGDSRGDGGCNHGGGDHCPGPGSDRSCVM